MGEKHDLIEIKEKLDKIDEKLDNFIERISAAEIWIKGHSTILAFIGTTILLIIGYIITGAM